MIFIRFFCVAYTWTKGKNTASIEFISEVLRYGKQFKQHKRHRDGLCHKRSGRETWYSKDNDS